MQEILVVGAGPVGALAAAYAARRGHSVEVYELRPDLRDPQTTPLNFTKSINLAVSERGLNGLRHAGIPGLERQVLADSLPMRGRMIHGKRASGEIYEESQEYDIHGRCSFASDRHELNKSLLAVVAALPNVKLFFDHKLTSVDFIRKRAWFEARGSDGEEGRAHEIEVSFDLLIGADGAHSVVRHHMMRFAKMDYAQEYIDTLWCEFHMAARDGSDDDPWQVSKEHLHIWPGKQFMFIAIPNLGGSFTCTLFLPSAQFAGLEADPPSVPAFFDAHFPGVTEYIPPADLISSFAENPHLPLISIRCSPHHYGSSAVIVGDAAHAMVPFYGQGMNAGFEDVRALFEILDKHSLIELEDNTPDHTQRGDENQRAEAWEAARKRALAEYSAVRVPDAHAINDMALANYVEMRASVLSPVYRLRKFLEETLSKHFPWLGWRTKYARVSFGNERYSEVVKRSEHQGRVLAMWTRGAMISPVVAVLLLTWWRNRKDPVGWAIQTPSWLSSALNK